MWLYLGVRRRKIHNCNRHLSFRVPFFLLLHFSVFSLNSETIIFNPPTEPKNRLQMLAKAIHNKSLPSFDFFSSTTHPLHHVANSNETAAWHFTFFCSSSLFIFLYHSPHSNCKTHPLCLRPFTIYILDGPDYNFFHFTQKKKREKKTVPVNSVNEQKQQHRTDEKCYSE